VFYAEGSPEAEAFARERILRVLQGKVELVVRGLRQMATKRGLCGAKKQTLAKVCAYRITRETNRLYPHRQLVAGPHYYMPV
jgi:hypothetical protein